MLKIGILGIGNCGNQIANIATREGFETFCINTSEKDLETIDKNISVFLFGSDGAGKDRNIAKSFVKRHYKSLISSEEFDLFIGSSDIIFITSSCGGGTGSGVSIILTDILTRVYPNKVFITVGILPTINDSIGAQRNSLEYLKELKSLGKGFMLYDNNKFKDKNPSEYMETVNNQVIQDIMVLRGDYCYQTQYGMVDDADMLKLLTLPGMISVTQFTNFFEKDMDTSDSTFDTYLLKVAKYSASVDVDRDRIVKRMGIIVNIDNELSKYYDSSLSVYKAAIGEPLEIFEHYYIKDKSIQVPNRVVSILSGLSLPDDRTSLIINRIHEVEEALNKKKESSVLDSVSGLDDLKIESVTIDRARQFEKNDINSLDFDFLDSNY